MALVKCPHCNKEVEENKFCPECGKSLIIKKKKKLSKFAKRNIIFFSVLLVIIGAVITGAYFYVQEQKKFEPVKSGPEYENIKSILAPLDFELERSKGKTSYSISIKEKENDPSFFGERMISLLLNDKGIKDIDCTMLIIFHCKNNGIYDEMTFSVTLAKENGKYEMLGDDIGSVLLATPNPEMKDPLYETFKIILDNQ